MKSSKKQLKSQPKALTAPSIHPKSLIPIIHHLKAFIKSSLSNPQPKPIALCKGILKVRNIPSIKLHMEPLMINPPC